MLEPPAIPESVILACLRREYGLQPADLTFLPFGADLGTAVYRAVTLTGMSYFVKLRFGQFDEVAALLPAWLATQDIDMVMAPLPAGSGQPWAETAAFTLLLYPFVDGQDAYAAFLSDGQWIAFGRAVRRIHDAALPEHLASRLPRETYSPYWRDQLRRFTVDLDRTPRLDAAAERFAAFLAERRAEVLELIDLTERLAQALRPAETHSVVCHTDLHAGNLLVSEDGRLFIVDWDQPLLASRERDLMYPGGGQGFVGRSPSEEAALFYQGYGQVQVDLRTLAYYRLERVVEDLAIFCQQLLGLANGMTGKSAAEREQALGWAISNFRPGGVFDIALETSGHL